MGTRLEDLVAEEGASEQQAAPAIPRCQNSCRVT
jgi:hypothetical protein